MRALTALITSIVLIFIAGITCAFLFLKTPEPAPSPTPTPVPGPGPQPAPNPTPSPAESDYIALGKIPVEGLTVTTTWYGALGSLKDGHYVISNSVQGGTRVNGGWDQDANGMGFDDNGIGAMGGKYSNLADQCTWAEDGTDGDIHKGIFGSLPGGTKLEIIYKGNVVVAEKGDISNGGSSSDGTRQLDVWWQTAKYLGLNDQPAKVIIHVVKDSVPTTKPVPYNADDPNTYAVGP